MVGVQVVLVRQRGLGRVYYFLTPHLNFGLETVCEARARLPINRTCVYEIRLWVLLTRWGRWPCYFFVGVRHEWHQRVIPRRVEKLVHV